MRAVVDDGDFLEVHEHFARNMVVGFARLDGRSVGIVANQPAVLAGVPRHRRLGEGGAFRPLLRRLQHPARHVRGRARLPARDRTRSTGESSAHGAKLLYAFGEATVPKVTVITRKAYGGAYCVMSSKHIRTDVNFAWPDGRDRGHGTRGGGEDDLPPRARRRRRTPRPCGGRRWRSSARSSPTPTSPRNEASWTR